MTFELTPDEDRTPEERAAIARARGTGKAKGETNGSVFLGFAVVLFVCGVIGLFVDGMTWSGFFGPVSIVALLFAGLGVLTPLSIFGHRRIVALVAGLVLLFVAIPFVMSLRTPQEVAQGEQETAAKEAAREGSYDDVEANPERYITLDYTNDESGRISGKLINRSPHAIANVKVRCDQYGASRKRLDRESLIIAKVVPANGSVSFGPLFVSYVDQQTIRTDCGPVDADIVP